MASMVTSVKSLNDALKDTLKTLNEINDTIKHISAPAQTAADSMRKTITKNGQRNLTKGSKVTLGTDGANFTQTGTGASDNKVPASQPQSAAQTQKANNPTMPWMSPAMAKFQAVGGVAQAAAGVAGGLYSLAPDLGATVARASNYYVTSQYSTTGLGYKQLQQSTVGALGGGFGRGVSGIGEDAAAAAILTQQYGYAPGSSPYLQTMREVGGAYRQLGMSNAAAATAIGGLQTGVMGAQLYQAGISQFDKNGNPVSESNLATQLFNRIFQGKGKGNAALVQKSLQYGIAGADLNAMGFSADQQQLFKAQFLALAQGKNADLSKMSGAGNPNAAGQQITMSQTQLMTSAQDSMIKGYQHAADIITSVNKKMAEFGQAAFEAKGYLQGLGQSGLGGALTSVIGGFTAAVKNVTEAYLALKAAQGFGIPIGSKAEKAVGIVDKLKGLAGKAFNFVKGQFKNPLKGGSVLKDLEILAADTAATAETAAVVGGSSYGGFGASFGAKGGLYSQTQPTPGMYSSTAANTSALHPNSGQSNKQTLSSPIPGTAPTTMYGAKDPGMWNGAKNYHTGDDYAVPVGTSVKAVADGVVFDDSPGADFGVYVQIDHGNGYQTLYGHLQSRSVKIGDKVVTGQEIGKSGQSGNVTGPHLHFEVRKGKNNPVNPSQFLTGTGGTKQTVSGKTVSAPGTILGTGDQRAWATDFLKGIGAPTTSTNIKAMTTWMAYEGGQWHNSAHYNPLNTTLGASGAVDMNSAGVKSYISYDQGLQSNISTLKEDQRGYASIRASLMKGNDLSGVLGAVNHSAWGTKIPGYGGGNSGFGASITAPQQGGSTNVQITVNIAQASQDEAIKFAKKVQSILEENNSISMMGTK